MAANMTFTDLDLDAWEIGGNLSWHPPEDPSEVTDTCAAQGGFCSITCGLFNDETLRMC